MSRNLLQGALIVAIALYLVPTGAHLFELPAKMALSLSDYMTVQRIYDGWQFFGLVIAVALILALLQAYRVRREPRELVPAVIAFLALAAALVVFLLFTLPVNVATSFWTVAPDPFEAARRQWEFSHASAALLTFVSLLAALSSLLRSSSQN